MQPYPRSDRGRIHTLAVERARYRAFACRVLALKWKRYLLTGSKHLIAGIYAAGIYAAGIYAAGMRQACGRKYLHLIAHHHE